ncbi:MAG: hypothetical protein ACRC78_09190, partial [Planktothrix sp.]
CKNKATAGEDSIKLKIDAQKEYVNALNEAKETITESSNEGWMKTHPHFQQVARIVFGAKERAEDAQAWIRLIGSFIAMSISYLTGFFFADEYKAAIKKQINIDHKPIHSPTQTSNYHQPITAQIKQAADKLDNQLNQIIAKRKETTMSKPSEEDYEINPEFLDNRSEPREQSTFKMGFAGFVNPNETATQKPQKNVLNPEKTDNATVQDEKTEKNTLNVVIIGDLGTHCQQCGGQFPKPRTGKKFCNNACRLIAWKAENGK